MTSTLREQLLEIVREKGYTRLDHPVELASGEMSQDFIDGKKALAHGADLEVACRALVEAVEEAGIAYDAIGGLTMGADQFAHGVAIVAHTQWFVVRKERKGRGTDKLVEGTPIATGTRVLLVDDVVSTGGSTIKALDAVEAEGATVVGAVTLLDRGDTATATFAARGIPYFPLLTYRDLGIVPVGVGTPPDHTRS